MYPVTYSVVYLSVHSDSNNLSLHLQGYHDFIDEMLPHESPVHYGLHPNAEIEFLTVTSDNLFHTLLELQSPDAVMGEGASQTLEEKVATPTSSIISFCLFFFFLTGIKSLFINLLN